MHVRSPLATLEVGIGTVERRGNSLVVHSRPGSTLETEITISAGEVLGMIGRVLATPASLLFVVGLPFFWLRERLGLGVGPEPVRASRRDDINKPW